MQVMRAVAIPPSCGCTSADIPMHPAVEVSFQSSKVIGIVLPPLFHEFAYSHFKASGLQHILWQLRKDPSASALQHLDADDSVDLACLQCHPDLAAYSAFSLLPVLHAPPHHFCSHC